MATQRAQRRSRPGLVLVLVVFPLVLCASLYACSAAPRRAAESFFAELKRDQKPPYPLAPVDSADAAGALEQMKRSTGIITLNFHVRSTSDFARACLFTRASLPGGGRWLDVALERRDGTWQVTDLSFDRSCKAARKSGDLRLH